MSNTVNILLCPILNPLDKTSRFTERVLVFSFLTNLRGASAAEEAFVITNAPDEVLDDYQLKIANDYRKRRVRSVSVGDAIEVVENGVVSRYLCESSGWKRF